MAKNKLVSNLFFNESSDDFFKSIRKTFIELVNQHYGYYISISYELTGAGDDMYREQKTKIFNQPVKIYGILENMEPEPNSYVTGMSDTKYTFKFSVAPELLEEQHIVPKDGDMIWIDSVFYEIQNHFFSRNYPSYVFNCIQARQQTFPIKFEETDVDF